MPDNKRMTTRLKELFERPEIFVLAGGMNAMGARMAEVAGYEAFYMSGGNTSAQLMGLTEGGTSMRDMVDNARRIVNTVDIPVFCDMDTGYGDAIQVYDTVKEYIRGRHRRALTWKTRPTRPSPARAAAAFPSRKWSASFRAAMDAKMEFDPDFVIVARCDFGGVPGATFEGVMERCLAYKSQSNADVICPAVQSWEENVEAIRRIPGPVLPLFTHGSQTHPTLQELQDAGASAAWYPALTTMAGLQASWDFLHDFQERGTEAIGRIPGHGRPEPVGRRHQRRHPGSPAHPGNGGTNTCRNAAPGKWREGERSAGRLPDISGVRVEWVGPHRRQPLRQAMVFPVPAA